MHLASAEFFLALIRIWQETNAADTSAGHDRHGGRSVASASTSVLDATVSLYRTTTTVPSGDRRLPLATSPISSISPGDRCLLLLPLGSLSPIRAARSPSPGVAWVCVAHQADLLSAVPISSSSASFFAATNLCRRNSISTKRLVPCLADLLSAARTMSPRLDLIHRKALPEFNR
uniref:Secreted protein n=1 Tax=Oryza barthii TaxID=65489 RepID=A0A0D3EMF3_9ORYZ